VNQEVHVPSHLSMFQFACATLSVMVQFFTIFHVYTQALFSKNTPFCGVFVIDTSQTLS